jgi:YkoY family integral membrane protein
LKSINHASALSSAAKVTPDTILIKYPRQRMDVQLSDFVTIGLLVLLEGLLSADNALVLALMILGLPRRDQKKALRYGLLGAFAFRTLATLLATYLIRIEWVKLLGGLYLLYLSYQHFFQSGGAAERGKPKAAQPWLGLSALWGTVVKVEMVNIAFSVDSILVAVAMSTKTWVVLSGGLLGIIAIRVVIAQLLAIVRKYPAIVDGAFIIIAWVGTKLLLEYLRAEGIIHLRISKWFSFGLIVVIFLASYLYARRVGPAPDPDEEDPADELLRS